MAVTIPEAIARLDSLGDRRDRHDVPFAGTYWVVPGKLLAGCYPGHVDESVVAGRCIALANAGIIRVISLMELDETKRHRESLTDYTELLADCSDASCVRFAISDMSVPDDRLLLDVLDAIDASIASNEPAYVHCWGGLGRTGTIIGCWLVRHGIASGEGALDVIRALRENLVHPDVACDRSLLRPSPETEEQRRFVIDYRPSRSL